MSTSPRCYAGKAYIYTHAHTNIFGSKGNTYAVYKQSSSLPVEQLSFAVRTHLEKVGHQMPSATSRALVLALLNSIHVGGTELGCSKGLKEVELCHCLPEAWC